jgi:flagellar biosynthesis component FlhA
VWLFSCAAAAVVSRRGSRERVGEQLRSANEELSPRVSVVTTDQLCVRVSLCPIHHLTAPSHVFYTIPNAACLLSPGVLFVCSPCPLRELDMAI